MLFKPKFKRQTKDSNNFIVDYKNNVDIDYQSFSNTNIESTSSFRYGDKPFLVSSQQLLIDWSKFENHTFFNSAVAKVNQSFDKIVNFYPFEGSLKQLEQFEDSLTGFEKWILNSFPKNLGYLNFSGSLESEPQTNGTYLDIIDASGVSLNSISSKRDGEPILDPRMSPFSFEFFIRVPEKINDNQIVIQKYSSLANHFSIALSQSIDTTSCNLIFAIHSGSKNNFISGSIQKGEFNYITLMYDKNGDNKLKMMVNNNDVLTSSNQVVFGDLNYNAANLKIGIGENFRLNPDIVVDGRFIVKESFSGSIDDLKYFHSIRNIDKIKRNKYYGYFPDEENEENLKLYYRFNEPSGDYQGNDLVIDYSGNSLHTQIKNYIDFSKEKLFDNPVLSENINCNPVLFPTYDEVSNFNETLLYTASIYDDYNPNIITKLIPKHYFQQGTNYRDFTEEFDKLGQLFKNISDKNIGKKSYDINESQLLIKLLLTYAKSYDEIKLYLDGITSFNYTEYDGFDMTPDVFLRKKASQKNIELPDLFSYANLKQALEGIDLNNSPSQSQKSLYEIQNLIWRRIIVDAPKQKLKKGTVDSIKSIFRNVGIEPDNILNFREYGGSKEKSLEGSRETVKDSLSFISFKNSKNKETTSVDHRGYPNDIEIPRLKSNYLSLTRNQPGMPNIQGTFVNGVSDNSSDNLLTSGSFTYEGLYKWQGQYSDNYFESLVRLNVTGSNAPSINEGNIINLIASNNELRLLINDSVNYSDDYTDLLLSNVNVFDNDIWHISFGKKNSHETKNALSSSYFLRASKQFNGELLFHESTSSIRPNYEDSIFSNITPEYNSSGSFIVIGSQSLQDPTTNFLNKTSNSYSNAEITKFSGFVTNIRFFSKFIDENEWLEHSKNIRSFGVDNSKINYNFNHVDSGSFERLVLQTDSKQKTKTTDANGNIRLFDFTKNELHLNGTNFEIEKNVFSSTPVIYKKLSSDFDINSSSEKIRVRSFQNVLNLTDGHYSTISPVYELLPSEVSLDDNRFSLDMSVMKGLNDNILDMFSDLSQFDNALGKPNLVFAEHYQDLQALREVYFNNLLQKIDLQKYRDLFKWIDNSFTGLVYSYIPRSTNFMGINFIYESHVLERNKFKYLYDEIYLKSLERDNNRGNIYLSQYVGKITRY